MNKKTKIAMLGVIALILVTIGITYAYWLVTKTQTNQNVISSACLDISISGEANDISLTNQFPLSDEDGKTLTPYEFTVTNNCNTSLDYQVALEATGEESDAIATSALKVALDDTITLLSNNAEIDPTISGAYESRKLTMGTLGSKESISYSLRLWIDEDAPVSEMNKTFNSKVSVTVGQGIENSSIKEGTLAYSILSNYGGSNAVNEIDETEYVHASTTDRMLIANYYWGTEYTYDGTSETFTLSGNLTQATLEECRNGQKSDGTAVTCGRYTLESTISTTYRDFVYEVTNWNSSEGTNYVTVNVIEYINEFSDGISSKDTGLFKTKDDLGNSYYFRGTVTNNYVQFGSYAAGTTVNGITYEEETPIFWRIARINGDGTIRLVYMGTEYASDETILYTTIIGNSAYNSNIDDAKYVGYTYEGTNESGETVQLDSTIKGTVDAWYDTHLEANYGDYIADGIFCNDRSIPNPDDSGYTIYAAFDRISSRNPNPTLICANKNDRYTVDDTTNGNGLLSNPVGLITADELVFCGMTTNSGEGDCYLASKENSYWTSSPYQWDGVDEYANVWWVYDYYLYDDYIDTVDVEYGVRPVINLKVDVEFTGNGSYETPYKIVTE